MAILALEASELAGLRASLPAWRIEDGMLVRRVKTAGWQATMLLANGIAFLAEAAWHHPDLVLRYGSVEIRLVTHEASGISRRDLELAERIDALVDGRPADGVLTGPPPGQFLA